jgi:secretion/DNA translocation related TadE-like protein
VSVPVHPARARTDERGAATVVALAMVGLLVAVAVAVMCGVAVVAAHRTAQSAADLAALAAADALQQGQDACARAAELARRNRSELRRCAVDGWNVAVVVTSRLRLPVGDVELPARGRAGPVATLDAAPEGRQRSSWSGVLSRSSRL